MGDMKGCKMSHSEESVIQIMKQAGINFVAAMPCDRTKTLFPLILAAFDGIEPTREEDGLGVCAGAWLAGAKPMMIIQSTGLGNMINALCSLNKASGIPIPILASFRGFYKEGIDSQIPLGRHLPGILKGCDIPFTLIDEVEKLELLSYVIKDANDNSRPHVALMSPKLWENSSCTAWQDNPPVPIQARPSGKSIFLSPIPHPQMTRYDAISSLGKLLIDQVAVCNLGIPSKELFSVKDRPMNYYMLGSMGLVSSIGLGVCFHTDKKVFVLEGDGSILMNPNALITIGQYQPHNLMIIALDNGAYGSTGSQKTYTQSKMDLEFLARSCGFKHTARVHETLALEKTIQDFEHLMELSFIHVVLKPGNAACPNIPLDPEQITKRFKTSLET